MIVLEEKEIDSVSGQGAFFNGLYALGATLRNYYGSSMTLEIFAAGNMCA